MDPHRDIRIAAESLLSSVNPHILSHSQSHSHSVNLAPDDLVAGYRPHGKMSTVRRFFCLFVTFDILFTSLMWLICVMMRGETLQQIFDREIIHYNVKTSLFDIVMVAVSRFILLLLFYALLYINNWSVIALSTAGTCAFLIAKVFVFDWPNASQPVYQVFLILTSFTLSWSEAWFLDFRVLPQELQAKQIIDSLTHHGISERTPLISRHPGTSTHGESTVNWFSPVESPESSPRPKSLGGQVILTQEQLEDILTNYRNKMAPTTTTENPADYNEVEKHISDMEKIKTEEELQEKLDSMSKLNFSMSSWMKYLFNRDTKDEEFNPVWLTIDEYISQAEESMQNAWRVIHMPDWKQEKRRPNGDVVESLRTEQFGKVYRFTGIVECPPHILFDEFRNNLTKLPEWNPTILKSELIKEIAPGIDLSYQVTAGGGGGIISPRDFVILRRCAMLSRDGRVVDEEPYSYISSGVSVQVPGYPPYKDMVRGLNKVGCWHMKTIKAKTPGGKIEQHTNFQWLMCCDLKGKIPQFVQDTAFAAVMMDYIVHVRKFAVESKAQGKF